MTTNASPAPSRRPTPAGLWLRLGSLLALPPIVWAIARFDVLPHISLCLFERATGHPCPGCGMTRSMLRLSQGDVLTSLRMHPLGVVLAGLYFAMLAGTLVEIVRGGDPIGDFVARHGQRVAIALLVAFLAIWVVRAFVVPSWAPAPVR